MWRKRLLLTLLLLVIVFLLWQFTPANIDTCWQTAPFLQTAVWMGVTWSMDAHSASELTLLADDLMSQKVDTAFVYVSYLRADDRFNPTYDHAAEFLKQMRASTPAINWLAWVGVPISIITPDGTVVSNRLEDPDIRAQIAEFAAFTVTDLGFEGVHLNAELIPNDDPAFLSTLDMIRQILPEDAIFSTTAHALRSPNPITSIPYPDVPHHWTLAYLHEVSARVDQVALMAYDSGLPFPRDYRHWVAYQTQASPTALADLDTELYIGLPTSEEWTLSHQTQAETLAQALAGFRESYTPRISGIALYPYWDTTTDEWSQMPNAGC